jgi:hypothetical protein
MKAIGVLLAKQVEFGKVLSFELQVLFTLYVQPGNTPQYQPGELHPGIDAGWIAVHPTSRQVPRLEMPHCLIWFHRAHRPDGFGKQAGSCNPVERSRSSNLKQVFL